MSGGRSGLFADFRCNTPTKMGTPKDAHKFMLSAADLRQSLLLQAFHFDFAFTP